jgi:antitoxin component YwqK of YwqJK toxin-antitoxin module
VIFSILLGLFSQVSDSIWRDSIRTDSGLRVERKFFVKSTGHLLDHDVKLNGRLHGTSRSWYPSGKLEREFHYRSGLWIDTSRSYFETGKPSGLTVCDHNGDSCTSISYLPDGRISGQEQSKKGVNVGHSWSKYPDGKWRQITENDEIGRYHGLRATWDSLGRPIDSIVYIHGEILRSSRWYPNTSQLYNRWSYDSSDVVARKADQRVLEASVFGPDGTSWGQIVNGNGELRFYSEGKLEGTDTYKNGVLIKSTHKYLDDGSLNPLYKKKGKR